MRFSGFPSLLLLVAVVSALPTAVNLDYNSGNNDLRRSIPTSIKDQPGLTESKRKPPLKSGNLLITADPSLVLSSAQPDYAFPPSAEFRKAQGLDTLRGFISYSRNYTTNVYDTKTTIAVFDVPEEARGKLCSFHFFFGVGDSEHVREELVLWSLGCDNVPAEEFTTTWNHRPYRNQEVARLRTGEGDKLSLGQDGNDAKWEYYRVGLGENLTNVDGSQAFSCDTLVGRTAWELEPRVTTWDQKSGLPIFLAMAWSMNKGLAIEVHGIKAKQGQQ